jgi:hypothetical protein
VCPLLREGHVAGYLGRLHFATEGLLYLLIKCAGSCLHAAPSRALGAPHRGLLLVASESLLFLLTAAGCRLHAPSGALGAALQATLVCCALRLTASRSCLPLQGVAYMPPQQAHLAHALARWASAAMWVVK